jgi:diguanylate cyclase (GGDEF)-like protein
VGALEGFEPLNGVSRTARRAFAGAVAAVLVLLAALLAHVLQLPGARGGDAFFDDWAVSLIAVGAFASATARAVRFTRERRAWGVLAAGLGSYAVGTVVWSFHLDALPDPPFPSVADPLWLALFPCAYVAMTTLARVTLPRLPSSAWLDGLIASLTGGAVFSAFIYDPLTESATGSAAAIATNAAYPLFDLGLVATVLFVAVARCARPDPRWLALGAGALPFAIADTLFVQAVATGAYVPESLPNLMWALGLAAFGLAGWMPARPARRADLAGRRVLSIPFVFALGALGILVSSVARVDNWLTTAAAGLAVACALVRMALTLREVEALSASREEALTDDLTGLPNRRRLMRGLEADESQARGALLLLDLDDFKEVNDTLGHEAGDGMLRAVAERMRAALGPGALLARLGGDEFAIALPGGEDPGPVADRLSAALREPVAIEDLLVQARASIGIALADPGSTPAELLRCADVAMYRAKHDGSPWAVYDAGQDEHSRDRLSLTQELREAIAREELVLHFQPQVHPRSGETVAAEALVRWEHPQRGLLAPGAFLPLAERAHLMRPLFNLVLRRALAQADRWEAEGRPLRVAVNLSVSDALSAHLIDDVQAALGACAVDPGRLKLEITEDAFLGRAESVQAVLRALVGLGVGISLDDYGTGEASLGRLRELPLEELKIDRRFIARLAEDLADQAIVASTIQLCHRLGVRVVAEGVEDAAAVSLLAELGCDLVQGYATGRPAPAQALTPWVFELGPSASLESPDQPRPRVRPLGEPAREPGPPGQRSPDPAAGPAPGTS